MQQENRRNGKQAKTISSSIGAFELETPRDRNGTFDSQTVLTHELDNKIIRLFGSGMSYSDISKNVKDIYGIEVLESTIH